MSYYVKPRIRLYSEPTTAGVPRLGIRLVTWQCEGGGCRAWGITPYLAWKHWRDYHLEQQLAAEARQR